MHGILAHLGERIDMNDGVGLGPISEEGLEASNKELRRGKAQFSRKDDLSHGLRDCWKRQFIKSDGIVNNFKKEDQDFHRIATTKLKKKGYTSQ